jgi:peptidoglycan hydrolase-like protein with peptidoglycan-binding domain
MRGPRRGVWVVVAAVVVVGIGAGAYALGRSGSNGSAPPAASSPHDAAAHGHGPPDRPAPTPLAIASSAPADGATGVASNGTVTITFTDRVKLGAAQPQISPALSGTWGQASPHVIVFTPSEPMIPFTKETVTVPGGPTGIRAEDGATLPAPVTIGFTVADGDMTRLQQLLALLAYMPVSFTPSGPPPLPVDAAQVEAGSFAWRWTTLPPELTTQWTPGYEDAITKGAIMTFQSDNGLSVDGLAGPRVWATVLADIAAHRLDPAPYTYVLVSKTLPQNLTLWDNGGARYSGIPVNTGLHGADTTDGTYQVFEHVTASEMKGTNPDGSHYDDPNVPWASYFNGGDALHGFVRPSYGSPQSNGCVEMTIADAGMLWPLTPIGTLVTVVGPAS